MFLFLLATQFPKYFCNIFSSELWCRDYVILLTSVFKVCTTFYFSSFFLKKLLHFSNAGAKLLLLLRSFFFHRFYRVFIFTSKETNKNRVINMITRSLDTYRLKALWICQWKKKNKQSDTKQGNLFKTENTAIKNQCIVNVVCLSE